MIYADAWPSLDFNLHIMIIELKKFGTTLTSRQMGKEAFAAFRPMLDDVQENENVEIKFEGVNTFAPSWGDEFLTPLIALFPDRVMLERVDNPSVRITLELLESINGVPFVFRD